MISRFGLDALPQSVDRSFARGMHDERTKKNDKVESFGARMQNFGKTKGEKSKREESSGRGQTTKTEGDSRDLQKRMDKLEEKMNRVLQALENAKPSGS